MLKAEREGDGIEEITTDGRGGCRGSVCDRLRGGGCDLQACTRLPVQRAEKGDQSAAAFWVDVQYFLPDAWSQAQDESMAQLLCSKLKGGESEGELIAEVAKGNASMISNITYVVHAAEWHFCPSSY